MKDEASYLCDSCGEEIVVPIDVLSAGAAGEENRGSNNARGGDNR
jgi:hypothetical protein